MLVTCVTCRIFTPSINFSFLWYQLPTFDTARRWFPCRGTRRLMNKISTYDSVYYVHAVLICMFFDLVSRYYGRVVLIKRCLLSNGTPTLVTKMLNSRFVLSACNALSTVRGGNCAIRTLSFCNYFCWCRCRLWNVRQT